MWSGALRLRPIKRSSESRNPSVWRSGRLKTTRSVNAVRTARFEYRRWPPRRPFFGGTHAAIASSAQPDRDAAAAPEATLVLPPVPDSVLLLVLAVDSARLRCDHDVTPPISMMDWTPPPPLACSLTPIHAPTPLFRTDCVVLKSTRTNRGRTIPVSLVKWRAALIAQDLRRTAERLAALPVDARASQRGNSGIAVLCLSVLHS